MRRALGYLEKALRIETRCRVAVNPAGTRLNLCAVLSQVRAGLPHRAHVRRFRLRIAYHRA